MGPSQPSQRLALLLLGLIPALAIGQQPLTIPANVETVVSGGTWRAGNNEGIYRVIVRTGGFEHIVSQVQIDWIAQPRSNDEPMRVVASKTLETGAWRISQPRIVKTLTGWSVVLDGVETHFDPAPKGAWEVKLGEPGSFQSTFRQQ